MKCHQCPEVAPESHTGDGIARRGSFLAAGLRVAVGLVLVPWLATPGQAAPRQALPGHVPAAAARLAPLERLAGTNRLRLAIGLPVRDPAGMTNLLRQLYDPASPRYRQYLTPAQFTERFGPTEQDYQAVTAFARTNGFTVTATHPNRLLLDVEAPVADIERTFHLNLRVYRHPKEARTFYAPDAEPSLDLAVPVLDISGLDNYSLPQPAGLGGTGSWTNGAFMARDLRAAYVPGVSLDGTGQSVGLLEFDGYYASDITAYESLARLQNAPLVNVPIDGVTRNPGYSGISNAVVEVSLDIEMAVAMAPGLSQVIVYEAPPPVHVGNDWSSYNTHWLQILNRMASDNSARQLSSSWVNPHMSSADKQQAEQSLYQMAAQGQSFFQASGDYDAYPAAGPFPVDSPNVTSVGGTSLTTTTPGGVYYSETVWNWGLQPQPDGSYKPVGSSGGISTNYAIPWWQQFTSMAQNGGSKFFRNIPDVAMAADNILYVANGQPSPTGGTSAAAPLWAGFTALVNQQAGANGKPSVGFLNPALYAIGNGSNYTSCFHDITTGSNSVSGPFLPDQFVAVPGYDLCTGWGTPNGQNLINALAGTSSVTNVTTNVISTVVSNSSLTNLYSALLAGGRITFSGALTFNLTNAIPIVRDTILDAGPTNGPSVVFNGGNATRLFTVCSNVTLQLINVTLTGGSSATGGAVLNQGGTFIANGCLFTGNQSVTGGAILNQAGTVIATNCLFSGNAAVGPSGAAGAPGYTDPYVGGDGGPGLPGTSAAGGAIYTLAPAEFYLCRFAGDTATGGNGGPGGVGGVGGSMGGNGGDGGAAAGAFGGAIFSTNRLVLSECTFEADTVAGGNGGQGGLAAQGTNTTTTFFRAAGLSRAGGSACGGAIYCSGQLLVSGCTFATNSTLGGVGASAFPDAGGTGLPGLSGGASLGGAIYSSGTNALVNCTFFANSVQGGAGGNGAAGNPYAGGDGGAGGAAFGGALEVAGGRTGATNCTFANGSTVGGVGGLGGASGTGVLYPAPGDPGTMSAGGGNLAAAPGGTLTLENCIVANSPSGGNAFGSLVDAGHNLSSDATCHFTASGSMNNTDPLLGPLGDYGGPTQTIPLLVTTDSQGCQGCNGLLVQSPAIDAGVAILGLATDQRGVPRPQGMAVDMGAFECVAVTGHVQQYDGTAFVNATIWLLSTFSPPLKAVTDAQGRYQIVAPPDVVLNLGVYRVEPEAGNVIFSPAYSLVNLPSPVNSSVNLDFAEVLAMGQVRQGDGSPFTNITVTLVSTSSPPLRVVTDAQGNYQFTVPPGVILVPGAYQVAAEADGAVFSPPSAALQLGSPSTKTNLVFTECVAVGQVRQCDGTPFTNVTVSLLTTFSPFSPRVTTATDALGHYQLAVPPGMTLTPGVYQVVPAAGGAVFLPSSVQVQVGPSMPSRTHLDFASPLLGGFTAQTQRGFHVTGWAAPGQVFRVEVAPALPAPFWQPLGTVTNGADGLLEFTDPTAWNYPARFYRLVPQNPPPGP